MAPSDEVVVDARFLEDHDRSWVLEAREHLQRVHARGLILHMAHNARDGFYEEAFHVARWILVSGPYREDVQRQVMRLFVPSGQRAEAVRQFEHRRLILYEDSNLEPMPQTMALRG